MQQTETNSQAKLASIMPGMKSVAEAPTLDKIVRALDAQAQAAGRAQATEAELERAMQAESRVRYKAIDASGNVWEMANPALMTYQAVQRRSPIRPVYRKMLYTAAEARALGSTLTLVRSNEVAL